jgi:hypothetical protein
LDAGLLSLTYASIIGVKVKPLATVMAVEVGEIVDVCVGVGVAVEGVIGVKVGVLEAVAVSEVGEAVKVRLVVKVAVLEAVGVLVGVGEGVIVSVLPVSIMSCGAFAPDSRLARLISVELAPVRTMLKVPFPVM